MTFMASIAPVATTTKPRSRDLLPQPFDWIEIPGKGYSIAKYPVTNAQFKLFIDAGGYTNPRWWTEIGWEARNKGWKWQFLKFVESGKAWHQPRFWTDTKWNQAEQPVVGVSWHEAVAYCLWLNEMTEEEIRLPTEDEWLYAAQGADGREFPWGNKWNHNKCNNSAHLFGSDRTTPVRRYEGNGDSPFGVVDMTGNTSEWCLTDYESRTNDIHSIATNRVLRGGAWFYSNSAYFSCDFRGNHAPHDAANSISFRLASSS